VHWCVPPIKRKQLDRVDVTANLGSDRAKAIVKTFGRHARAAYLSFEMPQPTLFDNLTEYRAWR